MSKGHLQGRPTIEAADEEAQALVRILAEAIKMECAHGIVTLHEKTARRILRLLGGADE